MAARIAGPKYIQEDDRDTCTAVINPGPTCDSGLCVANCQRQYRGGVGQCIGTQCRCVYTCAFLPPPPAAASN
ncbi:hypothetical protein E2562_002578 [Oryza meyeriana var. granulata]|uniref:Uncharacterized protein n=1 Tax=Oryza meyeriana var. granulata TaxID=110450 RepID=A0A6G1F315_9ORYZ|nr:hypothetical protein E2562_002578 [Oryza meyeriana var. granulata]